MLRDAALRPHRRFRTGKVSVIPSCGPQQLMERGHCMNIEHIRTIPLAAIAALLPAAVSAFDYRYVEGGFLYRDAYYENGSGLRITGSLNIVDPISAFAEF